MQHYTRLTATPPEANAQRLFNGKSAAAKQRVQHLMEGFVLAKNQPMLRLAARLGFSISPDPDDPAVRICRLQLADC